MCVEYNLGIPLITHYYLETFNNKKLLSNNGFTENQQNTNDFCKLNNNNKKARKQTHYKLKSSLATKAHQSETENGCILQKNK